MSDPLFELKLEDKLYRTKYEPDTDHPHVVVDLTKCATCEGKMCVLLCPAGVYKRDPNDETKIVVSHDNCLECGTCCKICDKDAIDWSFPEGGQGVKYRFG